MKRVFSLFLAVFMLVSCNSAFAITSDNLKSLYGNNLYYDTNQCATSGPAATSAPVTPGAGAPDGSSFPNLSPDSMANAINTFIAKENPQSKMTGLGSTIVADAQHSNVSPFLIVAISHKESSLSSPSDFNVIHGSNSFGRSAGAGQPSFQGARAWYKWNSVAASVDYTAPENQNIPGGGDFASYLRNQYGKEIDANSGVFNIIKLYAPGSDGNNPVQYAADVNGWVQSLISLTNGAPATSTVTPSPTTPNTTSSCACSGQSASSTPGSGAPVIVLDPGHSGQDISVIDPVTGLIDHDYPNPFEIDEVFTIAKDLQSQLTTDGYKVVLTKQNVMDYVSLRDRANIANSANAALAVSIHDDHTQNYGSFQEIYDQQIGAYRTNAAGINTTFSNQAVADKSSAYAKIFQQTRQAAQGIQPVIKLNNFNGRAGLSPGNIPLVQLFATVPWVYNETGASNITPDGLKAYEKGILDGIEKSVPVGSTGSSTSSSSCGSGTVVCNSGDTSSGLSATRQSVVCLAQQELATWKSQPGYPWTGNNTYAASGYLKYSQNSHEEWCADFTSWLYDQAKYPLKPDPNWRLAGVVGIKAVGELNTNFHWHQESTYTPKPGDLAIHFWAGPSNPNKSHVDIVTVVKGNQVTTIGGDSGHGNYPGGSIVDEGTITGFHANSIYGYVTPD